MSLLSPPTAAKGIMNMSSVRLEPLIREFPEESQALHRLKRQLDRLQRSGKYKELTLERIYELAEPSSQRVLLHILGRLCQQGVLSEAVRVLSPTGTVIDDFPSIEDVPPTVTDWQSGRVVDVDMDLLRMIYKVRPPTS